MEQDTNFLVISQFYYNNTYKFHQHTNILGRQIT